MIKIEVIFTFINEDKMKKKNELSFWPNQDDITEFHWTQQ